MERPREWKVVIRSALASAADETVMCPGDWTVGRLKSHLEAVLTAKPKPDHQKLIYAGKCLQDEQILGEVLAKVVGSDEAETDGPAPQVFHLVYTPPFAQSVPAQPSQPSPQQRRRNVESAAQPDASSAAQAQPTSGGPSPSSPPAAQTGPWASWGQPWAAAYPDASSLYATGAQASSQQHMAYYNAYLQSYMQ